MIFGLVAGLVPQAVNGEIFLEKRRRAAHHSIKK
jgi:hypothetical protein